MQHAIRRKSEYWQLTVLWAGTMVILISLMGLVGVRFQLQYPDMFADWTIEQSLPEAQRYYIADPFLNPFVAFDSEYYLAIAINGYGNESVLTAPLPDGGEIPRDYGFLPLYPLLMRIIGVPLGILGMEPIPVYTLAGMAISIISSLVACFALYDLFVTTLGRRRALRSVFYLLTFPSAFIFVMVYTDSLTLALLLIILTLLRRRQLLFAAVLSALAVWLRLTSVILILPLAYVWWQSYGWRGSERRVTVSRESILAAVFVCLPIASYLLWRVTLGDEYALVQGHLGRGGIDIVGSVRAWGAAVLSILGLIDIYSDAERLSLVLEVMMMGLGLLTSLLAFRYDRLVALFSIGLAVGLFFSGPPGSHVRYMLAVPALFLMLAVWGRRLCFDRLWSLVSIVLLTLGAVLFTFNFFAI
ncbi:MAG: hypothetical protein SF123_22480 [Chloroflexota bacterium]|nr:hypothetical protein [Chloroflexota bacterium]